MIVSVFQPKFILASGPQISAFLVGNISGVSLTLSDVSPLSATGEQNTTKCINTMSIISYKNRAYMCVTVTE